MDKQILSDAKADLTSPTPCGNDLSLPYPLNENKKYKPSYISHIMMDFHIILSMGPQWAIQLNLLSSTNSTQLNELKSAN